MRSTNFTAADRDGPGQQQDDAPVPAAQPAYRVVKRRWWEVRDPRDELVCVTVYERGAAEVVRRLAV